MKDHLLNKIKALAFLVRLPIKSTLAKLLIFFLPLILAFKCLAQPDVLNVYQKGKIILSKSCGEKEKIDTTDEGRLKYVHKVSKPKLYFYKTLKSNPKKVALLVLPGGGYGMVSIENEGSDIQ
jgi:hypothetical protein